jgi:hypothetical protein
MAGLRADLELPKEAVSLADIFHLNFLLALRDSMCLSVRFNRVPCRRSQCADHFDAVARAWFGDAKRLFHHDASAICRQLSREALAAKECWKSDDVSLLCVRARAALLAFVSVYAQARPRSTRDWTKLMKMDDVLAQVEAPDADKCALLAKAAAILRQFVESGADPMPEATALKNLLETALLTLVVIQQIGVAATFPPGPGIVPREPPRFVTGGPTIVLDVLALANQINVIAQPEASALTGLVYGLFARPEIGAAVPECREIARTNAALFERLVRRREELRRGRSRIAKNITAALGQIRGQVREIDQMQAEIVTKRELVAVLRESHANHVALNAELPRPRAPPSRAGDSDGDSQGPFRPLVRRHEGDDREIEGLLQAVLEEHPRLVQQSWELADHTEDVDKKLAALRGIVFPDAQPPQFPLGPPARERIDKELLIALDYWHLGSVGEMESALLREYLQKGLWVNEIEEAQNRRLISRRKLIERAVVSRKSALMRLLEDSGD